MLTHQTSIELGVTGMCDGMPNNRFERDAPTAGFAACFRVPQAKR